MDDSDSSFFKTKCKNRNGIFHMEFSDLVCTVNTVEGREFEGKKRKEIS